MEPSFIQLKDGRQLAFAEYGQTDDVPLLVFHGTPGSHIWVPGHIERAQKAGIRLIVPARPGYGRSDPKPGYTLLDWPDDVIELADMLSLRQFGVIGFSGGGPYALVCAAKIPDRLAGVGVVSSPAPPSEDALTSMPSRAEIETQYGPFAQQAFDDPADLVNEMIANAPEGQGTIMEQYRGWLVANFIEAFRQGPQAFFDDGETTLFKSWGFALDTIGVRVYVWHGEDDHSVPIANAHLIAKNIPDCIATYLPGVDHLLPFEALDNIYRTLLPTRNS